MMGLLGSTDVKTNQLRTHTRLSLGRQRWAACWSLWVVVFLRDPPLKTSSIITTSHKSSSKPGRLLGVLLAVIIPKGDQQQPSDRLARSCC